MYQSFFGLSEAPFSIAPDPRYLYMSRGHQEALAHLLYGIRGEGGFVLLTGEVGAGKTTICRCLLEQVPDTCDVAYVFNPRLTVTELLSTLCTEFGIDCPDEGASVKAFVDRINAHLLDAHARGRSTVLIIDEAQNLSAEVLEQMRLLTNLETNQRKLLQIILLGQPELADMLARPELRQLAQRIVARYHLGPLTKAEAAAYVRHRLAVSGARDDLIPARLLGRLHRLSGGVPRVLNLLCDRALLGAYAQGRRKVDRTTVDRSAREVFGKPRRPRRTLQVAAAALMLAASAAVALALYQHRAQDAGTPVAHENDAPAAETAVAPPAYEAALLGLPDDVPAASSRKVAYSTLLRAWGEDADDAARACDANGASGWRCRSARGGLDELRGMNRPAVLDMKDAQGRVFLACLTALDDRSATFSFGERTLRVPLEALALQWTGQYTVMWRMPAEIAATIRPGERGASVAWLRKQLATPGAGDAPASDVYDEPLQREVKQFQLAHGLVPDGMVGAQTLLHLASINDPAAPLLAPRPGER